MSESWVGPSAKVIRLGSGERGQQRPDGVSGEAAEQAAKSAKYRKQADGGGLQRRALHEPLRPLPGCAAGREIRCRMLARSRPRQALRRAPASRRRRATGSSRSARESRPRQHRLKQEPLRYEAVQGRQRGNRKRADQPEKGRFRHSVNEAAQAVEVFAARGVKHRARPKKSSDLNQEWFSECSSAAAMATAAASLDAGRLERDRKPDRRRT